MSGILHIEPRNGLCNRMRVLDSAYALAHVVDTPVVVHWVVGAGLSCTFEQLFEKPACVHRVFNWSAIGRGDRISRALLRCWHASRGLRFFSEDAVDRLCDSDTEWARRIGRAGAYVSTCERFFGGPARLGWFTPVPGILDRVDEADREYHLAGCVGVHIRRADHTLSKRDSPTSAFARAMERQIALRPDVRFFVASDDPTEEVRMRHLFNDRVVVREKRSVDRTRPEAAEDALVDLLCLSRTRAILGSYWSSFSITAAELGGLSLNIIREDA